MAGLIVKLVEPSVIARRNRARAIAALGYRTLMYVFGFISISIALAIIGAIVVKGLPAMSWSFLTSPPVEGMTSGGIWPMIRGSLLLMAGLLVLVPLIGILGGIWLAEYAKRSKLTEVMRSFVMAMAATPSIVFGLFGLAIFVLRFKFGFSVIAGWLTLSMMSVPVVVMTTEAAIKSVPSTMMDAGLALGFSRWQSLRKVVLPNAIPGIMTGLVLATGRAIGEAPPILLTAGLYYSTEHLMLNLETIKKPVANLPYHLMEGYRQGAVIPEKIIWGTCLTLMLMILLINLGAVIVRARVRARQQW